jgi:hypothetical protein
MATKKFPPRVTGGLKAKRKVEKLPPKPKAGAVHSGGLSTPKRPNGNPVKKVTTKSGVKKGKDMKPSSAGKLSGNAKVGKQINRATRPVFCLVLRFGLDFRRWIQLQYPLTLHVEHWHYVQ